MGLLVHCGQIIPRQISESPPPSGPTRLGLHVTAEELTVWIDRWNNGPYKTAGDVSTNSPGDKDRIVTQSNLSYSADRFAGYTGAGCVPADSSLPLDPPPGDRVLCGAFRYLITGNTTYLNNVMTELVAQAGTSGVDFTNSSKWCVFAADDNNFFRTGLWLTKMCYTYDYILAGLQAWGGSVDPGDQATIEAWLLGGANYFVDMIAAYFDSYIVNRSGSSWDNYTLTSEGNSNCTTDGGDPNTILWYGGGNKKGYPSHFHNRNTAQAIAYAMIGIQQDNAALKAEAIRFFKEIIAYDCYGSYNSVGSVLNDFERWIRNPSPPDPDSPGLGMVYALTQAGLIGQMADAFARAGDRQLIDFETSVGACGTAGGTKSLHNILTTISNLCDHTLSKYGTDLSQNNGNSDYLIDTNDEVASNYTTLDTVMAQPNLCYQDSHIHDVYMRIASGTVAYPASPSGNYYPFGGPWGLQPGAMLMFGDMEDNSANPYL